LTVYQQEGLLSQVDRGVALLQQIFQAEGRSLSLKRPLLSVDVSVCLSFCLSFSRCFFAGSN